jgi:hypothetical protein
MVECWPELWVTDDGDAERARKLIAEARSRSHLFRRKLGDADVVVKRSTQSSRDAGAVVPTPTIGSVKRGQRRIRTRASRGTGERYAPVRNRSSAWLEIDDGGGCRAVFAERAEIDARCHIRLARLAWGPKTSRDTLVELGARRGSEGPHRRNGSCGDGQNRGRRPADHAGARGFGLANEDVVLAVDDGPSVLPWHTRS